MPVFRIRGRKPNYSIPNFHGPSYQERQVVDRPIRQPGIVSDFLVPLLIAIAGGALISGSCVGTYSYIWGTPEKGWLPFFLLIWTPATTILFAVTQTAAWSLLWAFAEIVTRKDLDRSGEIGDRPILYGNRQGARSTVPAANRVQAQTGEDASRPVEEVEKWTPEDIVRHYPMRQGESVMQWFVRTADQIGTASRIWEPVLGRKRWTHYRDALIEAGWATWRSFDAEENPIPNMGWDLTGQVEEICDHIK